MGQTERAAHDVCRFLKKNVHVYISINFQAKYCRILTNLATLGYTRLQLISHPEIGYIMIAVGLISDSVCV